MGFAASSDDLADDASAYLPLQQEEDPKAKAKAENAAAQARKAAEKAAKVCGPCRSAPALVSMLGSTLVHAGSAARPEGSSRDSP